MELIQNYFYTYGYLAIFIFIFFGIVGIPSPEESFLIFVGIALSQGSLNIALCILIAFLGSLTGMITSYLIGYYIGKPFIIKYGKYIGLTPERWRKAEEKFQKRAFIMITIGYFIPGIRQINPYMAGLSRYKFIFYLIASTIGALVWCNLFILLGFFVGNKVHEYLTFTPVHIAIVGSILAFVFIIVTIVHFIRIKRSSGK
ncbi:DedA family protein [Terrilactibacillus laevilacticus]|uniref:DedA family protein n=1 Tax=Terrilactibacillus laevilacticus TaxID=1380157 RepID=A0ABW5PR04_9BACI|nr:DedA family protein [Terrilactibacillus laevilacticus]